MREPDAGTLQDYLDGRLENAERLRVEAWLREHPEQASRVESAREIGRALRGSVVEPSPGFYTRARTRFEDRGRRRVGVRFGWEALGLGAAAVLVAVLFVPRFLDRASSPPELPPSPPTPRAGEVETEPPPAVEDVDEALRSVGYVPSGGDLAEPPPADPPRLERQRVPIPAKKEPRAVVPRPPPAPAADPVPAPARDEENRMLAKAAESDRRAAPAAPAPATALASAFRQERTVTAAALAPGVVGAGATLVLPGEEAVRYLRDRGQDAALASLAERGGIERLVLVGPRGAGLVCAETRLVADGARYLVVLGRAAGGGDDGCAIALPGDALPVEVLGP